MSNKCSAVLGSAPTEKGDGELLAPLRRPMGSVDYWPLAIITKQIRETTPATTARIPRASPQGPPRWAVRSRGAALPYPPWVGRTPRGRSGPGDLSVGIMMARCARLAMVRKVASVLAGSL